MELLIFRILGGAAVIVVGACWLFQGFKFSGVIASGATFHFDHALRWSGFLRNPNETGILLASWLPVLFPASVRWIEVGKWEGRVQRISLAGGLIFLALTYSRGAWLAWVAGTLWIVWAYAKAEQAPEKLRRLRWFGLIVFGILFCWMASRAGASLDWDEGSIRNRLILWEGGLRMIAENPWFGVGWGNSGEIFEEWYQPLEMRTHYRSLINSYLTLAAEWGLPALAIASGCIVFCIMGALKRSASGHGASLLWPLHASCAAGLMAFTVAGIFNYSFNKIWLPLALLPSLFLGISLFRNGAFRRKNLGIACAVSFLIGAAVFGAGKWSLKKDPWSRSFQFSGTEDSHRITVRPRKGAIHGVFSTDCFSPAWGSSPGKRARALSLAGFELAAPIQKTSAHGQTPDSMIAWTSPSSSRALILLSPSDVVATSEILKREEAPLLLIAADLNTQISKSIIQTLWQERKGPGELVILEGVDEDFGLKWEEVIRHIRNFVLMSHETS